MHHRVVARRRATLLERNGDRCYYCGVQFQSAGRARPTIDHDVPESRGGDHRLANLVLCCDGCNGAKATLTRAEFESSAILHRRQVTVLRREISAWRRANLEYHPGLVFDDGGAWACPSCGASGPTAQSPHFVRCVAQRVAT